MLNAADSPPISKQDSWKLFDEIAPRYDLLNRVLSLGLDIRWRKKIGQYLPARDVRLLDIATGTADVLLTLHRECPQITASSGIDLAENMLSVGKQKIKQAGLESKIALRRGDAARIPFSDGSFDVVTIAFGIRNMENVSVVLREVSRVLASGGRVLILEFSLPRNRMIRAGYLFYLRHIVPVVGHLFSGHYTAYRYLNKTIEAFAHGREFRELMQANGFWAAKDHRLLFGVASIYQGDKA